MLDLKNLDARSLARTIDHSILPKDTCESTIREGCADARKYGFAAFYSSSAYWTPIVKEELVDHGEIEIGTGIAFPFGTAPASVKAFEIADAVKRGCTAIDMVMNVGAMKDGRHDIIREELRLFVDSSGEAVTKFILDVCFLSDQQITAACQMAVEAGVNFVKTSTGQFEGPTLEQFMLMRDAVNGTDVRVKVAGVKFPRPQNAFAFLIAGAERIGTRAGVEIVESLETIKKAGLLG
jgi:deoxyribose-phosphate aldolase